MQRVDVEIPVPARLGLSQAFAWAAGMFDHFRERGWRIEDQWLLQLGTAPRAGGLVPGCNGVLTFRASFGASEAATLPPPREGVALPQPPAGRLALPAGVVARASLREDGTVAFEGELTEGQQYVIRLALGSSTSGTHSG